MSGIRDIWLYANNVIRSARQIINDGLKPLNLSSAEGNILLHLLTQPRPLRQEELGEQLDISKPAISRALESLERKGYIVREKDTADMRARLVQLTGKAEEIGPQIEQVYQQVYALAAQGVSETEIERFIALFGRLSANFTAARAQQKQKGGPA